MSLYENVKSVAKSRGYSINQLEKELGFARSYISKFQKITPSMDKVQRIADFLDVTVDELMNGEKTKDNTGYYLNDETAAIAQEIFENRELRLLFDASRNADPEDLLAVRDMVLALKRKERREHSDS